MSNVQYITLQLFVRFQETVKKQTTAVSHLCKNVSEVFLVSPLRHHATKLLDKVAACLFIPECCIVCIIQV